MRVTDNTRSTRLPDVACLMGPAGWGSAWCGSARCVSAELASVEQGDLLKRARTTGQDSLFRASF